DPDRRMWLLVRLRPHVRVAIVPVFALPVEGLRRGPGFDDQIVRLLEALARQDRIRVGGMDFGPDAAYEARDDAAAADAVQHRDLFGDSEWVVPMGQRVPE